MKYSTKASLAFAVGASAASIRRDTCSFTLSSSGGESSKVGQLSDGQLRILGDHPTATFTISNGTTTDSEGRPCYLTSEANQYQCDTGGAATGGFAIAANGTYFHSGSSVFYACPSSDYDYNIYTAPVAGQRKCVKVWLTASGCFAPASISSSGHASASTSPAKTSVVTTTTTQQQTCAPSTVTISSPAQTFFVTSSAVSTAPGKTIYETKTLEETAPAQTVVVTRTSSAQTVYQTTTVNETASAQTVWVTESASTVYKTTTLEATAPAQTIVVTKTPSAQTVYATSTAPGQIVHETQTQEETAPVQTVYVTQTRQETAAPSTVTVTQTAAPSTVTVTRVQTLTAISTEQHTATESVKLSSAPITNTQVQSTTIAASTPKASSTSAFVSSAVSKASSAVSSAASKASSTVSSSSSCPTNLHGTYSSPNLIVPVSSASPDKSYGTSYDGVVNSTVSTLFNFDIPSSYASKTCSLVFLFPTQDMLETSSYTFSGSGAIDFKQLSTTVTTSSTYNSIGSTKTAFGSKTCTPGSWTVVDTFACPAGEAVSFEMSAGGSNTNLWWFEDYNPSPIGLFITTC